MSWLRKRLRGIRVAVAAYAFDPRIMLLTEAGPQIENESGTPLEVENA